MTKKQKIIMRVLKYEKYDVYIKNVIDIYKIYRHVFYFLKLKLL